MTSTIYTKRTPPFTLPGKRVWVAGHRGMVGSAMIRRLASAGCKLLTLDREQVDLRRQADVEAWINEAKPEAVIIAAATVGGIVANAQYPAHFLYDNLMIETNIIHAAYKAQVTKLLLLGSSCIYPKFAPQPMVEDALLTGPLEPTNEWYAVAKIAGIKICQAYRRQYGCDFISAMPTSLYGPGDNFDPMAGHVIPALIAKAHAAKMSRTPHIEIWGTGTPLREFMYIDDAADALIYLLEHYSGEDPINIGTGDEVSIDKLAKLVSEVVGFSGGLCYLVDHPDGTPRKLLDCSRMLALGWAPKTTLRDGLTSTYRWFTESGLASKDT